MDSKIKILIGVLVVGVVFIGYLFSINEKRCWVDEDCVLINKGCCVGCTPGDAVNKIAAFKINLIKKIKCLNAVCPLIDCVLVPTRYGAICENQECKVEEFVSCSRICSGDGLEYYSRFLNKTKNEIIQKCHCNEIPQIVKDCDVNRPEVLCFLHRIIAVGTVKEVKPLEYPFQKIEMKVDKSFNKRLKDIIVFKTGKEPVKRGDKIKAFLNEELNYVGIVDILTPEEYEELLDTKYFEYLPLSALKK